MNARVSFLWAAVFAYLPRLILGAGAAEAQHQRQLVLYLTFDEGRGMLARDAAGGPRHAILSDDVQWADGKFGKAVRFIGQPSSYVKLPLPSSWYVENQNALTVLAWVRSADRSGHIFFGAHGPADGRLYLAVDQGNRWAMGLGTRPWGRDERGNRMPADSQWHAVAMTLDHGTATLYVDGRKYAEKPYNDLGIGLAPRLGVVGGRFSSNFCFEGSLDELAIFKGVLSDAEIRTAMGGLAGSEFFRELRPDPVLSDAHRDSLVGEWHMDDGEGATAADSSGNGADARASVADWTEGVEGLALRLPARGDPAGIEVPHSPKLTLTNAFTLEAWLYWDPRGPNFAALFDKGDPRQLAVYFHRYNRNVHVCLVTDRAKLDKKTGIAIPHYRWVHLALTWSAETERAALYVDGKRRWQEKVEGTKLHPSDAPLLIGSGKGAGGRALGNLAGIIDEVCIYRKALPAEAFAQRYERLAEIAVEKSQPKWVPAVTKVQILDETCLDAETKNLTYPAFPLVPAEGSRKAVYASDFPSIQAAVDSLPSIGGMVIVPSGRWEIDEPIVLHENVTLVGMGASSIIVNKNQNGVNAIEAKDVRQYRPKKLYPPGASGHHGIVIARLQIRGNPKSGHGIYLHQSDHFTIETCWIFFHGKSGVYASYGEENDIIRGVISKWNGEHGLYVEGCHDTLITASHFEENRLDGIHVQKDNIQAGIFGCNAEDNGRFGIYNKGRWTQVVGCESDSNEGGAFVFIGPESEYATIVSDSMGTIRAVGAHNVSVVGNRSSIYLSNCHGCALSGNTGATLSLEDGCCLNAVTGNVMAQILVGRRCHDNTIVGNVSRRRMNVDNEKNAASNNVVVGATDMH